MNIKVADFTVNEKSINTITSTRPSFELNETPETFCVEIVGQYI